MKSSTLFEAEAPKRGRHFFLRRFAVFLTDFFAADFVFVLAFFAMLPS
jgi:hypothetical protein